MEQTLYIHPTPPSDTHCDNESCHFQLLDWAGLGSPESQEPLQNMLHILWTIAHGSHLHKGATARFDPNDLGCVRCNLTLADANISNMKFICIYVPTYWYVCVHKQHAHIIHAPAADLYENTLSWIWKWEIEAKRSNIFFKFSYLVWL